MTAALTRFRMMAYVVGIMLLVLVGVAMPLKYLAGRPQVVDVVAPVHGFLYVGYVAVAVDVAFRRRWSLLRTGLVLLGGAVPFLSFVIERQVVREVRERITG